MGHGPWGDEGWNSVGVGRSVNVVSMSRGRVRTFDNYDAAVRAAVSYFTTVVQCANCALPIPWVADDDVLCRPDDWVRLDSGRQAGCGMIVLSQGSDCRHADGYMMYGSIRDGRYGMMEG